MTEKETNKRLLFRRRAERQISDRSAGFTLIELLVAVSIFAIAVVSIAGIFMSTISAQRKFLATKAVQESARYILEVVTKEIRMSTINGAPVGGEFSILNITNARGETFNYEFDGVNKNLLRDGQPMNPTNVAIDGRFYIVKTDSSSAATRYRAVIIMKAEAENMKPELQTTLDLETAVTPRNPQS